MTQLLELPSEQFTKLARNLIVQVNKKTKCFGDGRRDEMIFTGKKNQLFIVNENVFLQKRLCEKYICNK